MTDWLPIHTAPKDGTRILLGTAPRRGTEMLRASVGEYHGEGWWGRPMPNYPPCWVFLDGRCADTHLNWWPGNDGPTHWMPTPEPP